MAAYPRKQTLAIFAACTLAVGGTAFYVYGQNTNTAEADSQKSSGSAVAAAAASIATGTIATNSNWKQEFLDTSSSTAFKTVSAKSVAPAKQAPLTPTDRLGQDFLTEYAQLYQSGLTTDSQTVANAMSQVVAQDSAGLLSPKTYSAKDIQISSDTIQSVATYRTLITNVAIGYSTHADEASIAADALATEDMDHLAQIDPIIAQYKGILNQLRAIRVPPSMVQYQISLLNGMSVLLFSAQAFRHMDTNALAGFATIHADGDASQLVDASFAQIIGPVSSQTTNP